MTQAGITIIDASDPSTALEVKSLALGHGRVELTIYDQTQTNDAGVDPLCQLAHLDEEGARRLFNWLGVWLHRA